MCGIAGIFSPLKSPDNDLKSTHARIADAMQSALTHRGPDAFDIWQDRKTPLTLIHRRLAIIDLSDDGKQPMQSASKRYVISYNGEIYNYLALKKELIAGGYVFKTKTDTEVILACCEVYGFEKTLLKLNGMFVIALWDNQERSLFLARDRFGKKPLYVGRVRDDLIFASELKALRQHPDFIPEINRDVLADYMAHSYVRAPHAIYQNTWQMPPASFMRVPYDEAGALIDVEKLFKPYWSMEQNALNTARPKITEAEALEQFEEKLELAVKNRLFTSDVPIGAFLSGGIDSSCIVALMQKLSDRPVKTFSIGFKNSALNEADKAKEIAVHLGTDHTEFFVSGGEALDVIQKLPDIYDEPFADSSQIPTYLISKLAKQHVTVALTGDGGDEVLGGYERHTHVAAFWDKLSFLPSPIRKACMSNARAIPQGAYNAFNRSDPRFGEKIHRIASLMTSKDAKMLYQNLIGAWPHNNNVVLGAQNPHNQIQWHSDLTTAENMMLQDCLSYRSDDLMVKADRASMANALELRAPLMDYELAEFAWQLPIELKIKNRQGKWPLRQIQDKYIPSAITKGPKQHFGAPIDDWLKGDLKELAHDMLDINRLKNQGLFDAKLVSDALEDYQKGKQNAVSSKAIWSALMFQIWHDKWL